MREYIKQGFEVLYADELMFTRSTVGDRVWSPKKVHYEIDRKNFNIETTAVIAAISIKKGVEHLGIYEKSIN